MGDTNINASKKTILMVEDDPLLVKMYTAKFTKEGFNIIKAQDGEEGLKLALSQKYDLLLLDVMMPKLSGLDLLTRLRQDPKGKNITVLVFSNLTQTEETQKAMSLGAKEYLIKANLTPSELVNKVRKYLV